MKFKNELILSSSRKSWKMSSVHGTVFDKIYKVPKYQKVWDDVWERDSYKCHYCNFQSKKHQEIHHLDDDHTNNLIDNLVTVCPLCHQNFHLDTLSVTNGGKIIWLPEMSQQELNYICRTLFIALDAAEQMNEGIDTEKIPKFVKVANMFLSSFEERGLQIEQHFRGNAQDPAIFATSLINMKPEDYEKRNKNIKNFKLLHFYNRYAIQAKYWRSETFKSMTVDKWEQLILNLTENSDNIN